MMKRHTVRYRQSLNCSENFLKVVLVTVCPLAKDNLVTGVPSLPFLLPLPPETFQWVGTQERLWKEGAVQATWTAFSRLSNSVSAIISSTTAVTGKQKEYESLEEKETSFQAILYSLVALLVLVMIVVAIFVLRRRRSNRKRPKNRGKSGMINFSCCLTMFEVQIGNPLR